MKVLVVIANYGTKNQHFLERLLAEYHGMPFSVKVVVLSNIPKDFGSDVEVVVGLPAKDPWSLPFGYKEVFAKRVDEYDLFIYSEDDTLIQQRNIEAFLAATEILPEDKIAGFLRYEIAPDGTKYYSTIHGHYHWDPNSALKIGDRIFAHYTNEHSACFILTQKQLRRAIASGGFLLPPRKGRYDMLVTAATDPYTQCGMKKLVCISRLDDFCLRHLPDVYLGKIGVSAETANREIKKLLEIAETEEICGPLFEPRTRLEDAGWGKLFYEPPRADILAMIPEGVRSVLSVGCGCGSTEAELVKRGIEVVAIPIDCVIGAATASAGIEVLPPSLKAASDCLEKGQFDCLLFMHVLHHFPDPCAVIRMLGDLLNEEGSIIASVPNFRHLSVLRRRILGMLPFLDMFHGRSFEKYGLHFTSQGILKAWLERCGFRIRSFYRQVEPRFQTFDRLTAGRFNQFIQRDIVVQAKRDTED